MTTPSRGAKAVQDLVALRFANGVVRAMSNATTSTTCQSTCQTLAIETGPGFYEDTSAYRDIVVTTSSTCSGLRDAMAATTLRPLAGRGDGQAVPLRLHVSPAAVMPRAGRRYPEEERGERLRRGRFVAVRQASTTGAGPACRSSCAPAMPREARRLLTIAFRTGAAMSGARAFIEARPDHISSDLGDPAASPPRSWPKCRPTMRARPGTPIEFTYEGYLRNARADPTERLMYDAMLGDRALFTNAGDRAPVGGLTTCCANPRRYTATPQGPTGRGGTPS